MLGEALSSRAAVKPKAAPRRPLATKRYRKLKVIRIAVRNVRLGSSPSSCKQVHSLRNLPLCMQQTTATALSAMWTFLSGRPWLPLADSLHLKFEPHLHRLGFPKTPHVMIGSAIGFVHGSCAVQTDEALCMTHQLCKSGSSRHSDIKDLVLIAEQYTLQMASQMSSFAHSANPA